MVTGLKSFLKTTAFMMKDEKGNLLKTFYLYKDAYKYTEEREKSLGHNPGNFFWPFFIQHPGETRSKFEKNLKKINSLYFLKN